MNIKQHFANSETLMNSYGRDSIFEDMNLLTIVDGYWYINGQSTGKTTTDIQQISTAHDLPPANTIEKITRNIEIINNRLSKIQKQLTYWDLYKMATQVRDPSELNSKFASLIPGQSLVINCYTFSDNNTEYHLGDVVVKDLDGEAIKIDALATGIYVPTLSADSNNNITITYAYSNTIPQDQDIKTLTVDKGSASDSNIYGYYYNIQNRQTPIEFEIYSYTDASSKTINIMPVIKFYIHNADNNTDELIDVHHTIERNGINWKVTWDFSSPATHMQVK